jgi:2-polyprenyl-3-methyl-5-hydroxy-6-metoxy-1,4-benzoquinol methylase
MMSFPGYSSRRIHAEEFDHAWLHNRATEMSLVPKTHRKVWEYAAIAQTYIERIGAGGSVLGFGVGKEPLPAWFAYQGARVLATDRPQAGVWDPGQHAFGIGDLPNDNVCPFDIFAQHVDFRPLDMRNLPLGFLNDNDDIGGYTMFDMLWSCSTVEHLGGISAGLQFMQDSMRFLKPGGIAVHTTEYNVLSDDETLQGEDLCVFRGQDFITLANGLKAQGDKLLTIDLSRGTTDNDLIVDQQPFTGDVHIHLQLGPCVFTSVLLVLQKGK